MSCSASSARVYPDALPLRAPGGTFSAPPSGASPAGDLQRQLANAALRGFYKSSEHSSERDWGARRRLATTITVAVASWGAVFCMGAALAR